MKSKLVSILLCIAMLGATVFLIRYSPADRPLPGPDSDPNNQTSTGEENSALSRAYVIETAHDAEDLMETLAYGHEKDYENKLASLVQRLRNSSSYLKDELRDYYGASYFSKTADVFYNVLSSPFTDSATFSSRVSKMLTELKNAYPEEAAALLNESDPISPMYYPRFDTDPNGTTTLAMLSIYRQQYQKTTNSILLTFGGNLVLGDTLLGAESPNSFKNQQAANRFSYPLYKLSSVLGTDSASFANLKAPLTNVVGSAESAGSIKGLPSYAGLIQSGGIDAVSLTDPDVSAFGQQGKKDTSSALIGAGVSVSEEGTICYYQTELGTVAYLSYDIIDEIQTNVNSAFDVAPKIDIAAAKDAGAKIVIVNFNWVNTEAEEWDPCMNQVLTARAAVDNGASLVIGSHPDAIEAVEQYNGVSIIYSTGNLFKQGGNGDVSFLFQQAFSLDASGNAVPGQIQVFPLINSNSADEIPTLALDADTVSAFKKTITDRSITVRYGVGKRNSFTTDHLNLISIQK